MLRQLPRLLLNLLTTLSLLLLLATIALCVRSFWHLDSAGNNVLDVASLQGEVEFEWRVFLSPTLQKFGPWSWNSMPLPAGPRPIPVTRRWSFLGVEGGAFTGTSRGSFSLPLTVTCYYLGLPYWVFCLVESLLPALHLLRRLRHRRYPPGLCPHCGYDLRASQLRCPECGSPIPASL